MIPLVLASVYGIARVARDGPAPRWAVLAGGGAGLAVLAKATTAAVAPVLAVAAVGALVLARTRPARAAGWIAIATASAALPVLPWLAVQHAVYGPGGAVDRFNALVGPLVGRFPRPPPRWRATPGRPPRPCSVWTCGRSRSRP